MDCSVNQILIVANDCCEVLLFGEVGCCDVIVMVCVCAQDVYCCTNLWDSLCVGEVSIFGCGVCFLGCSGVLNVCGWKVDQNYYDCLFIFLVDLMGALFMMCGGGNGCIVNCVGKQCGDDGCGGSCGICAFG